MARAIGYQMVYDAPLDAVIAMLADPAFREEVCTYQRVTRVDVTISGGPGSAGDPGCPLLVRIDQWQPTQGMPSFAKKIVGEETNILQEERWMTSTTGDISISIPGKPGTISGTAVLEEKGTQTVETIELVAKVNIPLVGGKLEGLIGDLILKALKAENKVGIDYLSR